MIQAPLYLKEAKAALEVFNSLPLVDVLGCPTFGEVGRDWQKDFCSAVFGAYNEDTGRQEIQEFFLLISKKNSKSTMAAAIMLTALVRNARENAEFIIIAPTKEVADNSYMPAAAMCRRHPVLKDLFKVKDHIREISHLTTGATLKVIAAENETVSGKKATGILIDELWIFGNQASAGNMLLEACGGLASRPEGFVIYLTTQSDKAPAGVFRDKLNYARNVRDGKIKDTKFLPIIYEYAPEEIKNEVWRDEKTWIKVNPNLGASVDIEYIRRGITSAESSGQSNLIPFIAKHLNIEIGNTIGSDNWVGAEYWAQCNGDITLEELIERSEVICVGIDGGGLDDLLGLGVVGRCAETRKWLTWTRAWGHKIILERRKSEASRFLDFEKDGDLIITKEVGDDVVGVAEIIKLIDESGKLDKIGCDPAGIGAILDALIECDIEQERCVSVSQGWRLNGAIKTLERKLAEKIIIHGGQRMMDWVLSNAKVEQKGNAISITKQASGTAKIDPLMALFNAVTLIALNPESKSDWSFMKSPIVI